MVVIVEKLAVVERVGSSSTSVSRSVGNSGNGLINLKESLLAAMDAVDGNLGNGFWGLERLFSGLKFLWVSGASKADGHSGGILWSLLISLSLSFRDLSLNLLRKSFMRLKTPTGIERRP